MNYEVERKKPIKTVEAMFRRAMKRRIECPRCGRMTLVDKQGRVGFHLYPGTRAHQVCSQDMRK